jgi:hypothetical protein
MMKKIDSQNFNVFVKFFYSLLKSFTLGKRLIKSLKRLLIQTHYNTNIDLETCYYFYLKNLYLSKHKHNQNMHDKKIYFEFGVW